MAKMTFAAGLRSAVAGRKDKWSQRIQAILDAPDSLAKRIFLRRMEAHVRVHLGLGNKVGIDWSKIDWSAVLDFILKLAAIILPLILAAGKPETKSTSISWKMKPKQAKRLAGKRR